MCSAIFSRECPLGLLRVLRWSLFVLRSRSECRWSIRWIGSSNLKAWHSKRLYQNLQTTNTSVSPYFRVQSTTTNRTTWTCKIERPVETPMKTPMETPIETPMKTPMETPFRNTKGNSIGNAISKHQLTGNFYSRFRSSPLPCRHHRLALYATSVI